MCPFDCLLVVVLFVGQFVSFGFKVFSLVKNFLTNSCRVCSRLDGEQLILMFHCWNRDSLSFAEDAERESLFWFRCWVLKGNICFKDPISPKSGLSMCHSLCMCIVVWTQSWHTTYKTGFILTFTKHLYELSCICAWTSI